MTTMRVRGLALALGLAWALPLAWSQRTINKDECGEQCAFVALAALTDQKVSLDEIRQQLGRPEPNRGYSMGQLQSLLESKGLTVLPVETRLEVLENIKQPHVCIATWMNRHYICPVKYEKDEVEILDPFESYRV